MSKYPGVFTQHLKLTYDKLLSVKPVKQVRKDLITNGVIIELIRLPTVNRLPWRAVIDRIIQLFGKNWPANEPSELTLIKTLPTLYKKYRSLMLKKNPVNIGRLQESPFHIPCRQLDTAVYSALCSNSKRTVKRKSLVRKENQKAFQKVLTDLCKELANGNAEIVKLRQQFTFLCKKTNTRNINRREKRKLKQLTRQEKPLKKLAEEKEQLRCTLKKVEKKLQESENKSTNKLRRCQKRYYRMRNKYMAKLRRMKSQKIPVESCSDLAVSEDDEEEPAITIPTFSNGHYNAKVRECCMQLLAHNVGIHNVETCISAVCDLIGCKIGSLPSKSNMMVKAQAVSHLQIADSVPTHSTNMLHSDGTTKFGEKYGGLQITTPESCCLSTMKAGGASDFKELLVNSSDISASCKAVGTSGTNVCNCLLASIKNTMSDRHIVEKKFNELLESYREEILPEVVEGWNDLTPEQQQSIARVNNFFCGLHFLVRLADTSAETMKQWEQEEEGASSNSEAGTLRLIRSTCKAVQKQCSQI